MAASRNSAANDLSKINSGFTPRFDPNKEIIVEDGVSVKGSGVLVFQGMSMTSGTNGETGEVFTFPTAVFGALDEDGDFRNIGVQMSKRTLGLLFKALGLEVPYKEEKNALAGLNVAALKNFTKKYKLDHDKALAMVQEFRGLMYFAVLDRKEGKSGAKYYSIDLATLSPVLQNGETVRAQPIEDTDPDSKCVAMDESEKEALAA